VPAARRAIARSGIDVLLYPDLGMDPMTLALAASRLAPTQAASWGHPATTGLATIDRFLSSEYLDRDDAQAHYTETLDRLPGMPVRYLRPGGGEPSQARTRAAFGLPEGVTLYGCPQSPFKFHPDFDAMLGAILRADRTGRLVLIRSRHEAWTDRLLDRLARSMRDVMGRVVLLPPLNRAGFLEMNAVLDVLLDPPHFGGGNTTLEAMAAGTPVVTWPSNYLKGRITAGLYERMGHAGLVAESHAHYVEIAARLGRDEAFRRESRAEIAGLAGVLFDDRGASIRLADWLIELARG
jgi:predicted O-linked N-acetylglucosamine transferase (SPINDLY family)